MQTLDSLVISDQAIKPGEDKILRVAVPGFSEYMPMQMQIRVIRSKKPGPRLLITGVVHGDEIIGVEIIHDLLDSGELDKLEKGDVIIIPIVNGPGFINNTRYLPDRRDLNRSFPGAEKGSLAGRLAHFLTNEILLQCTHGIDLHAGAVNHFNMPQIRINLKDRKAAALARAFGPQLILHAEQRPGSLRELATKKQIPMLLFEGSEAGRFDAETSKIGCAGIINVMKFLKMIPGKPKTRKDIFIGKTNHWMRSPETGIFYAYKHRGDHVKKNDKLGYFRPFAAKPY